MEGSKSICFHRFNKPSSVIWNIVNDISQLHFLLSKNQDNLLSEPIFYYLQKSKDIGAIFSYNLLSTYISYFKVVTIIETDYCYHCLWKAYHFIPSQPLFNFSMTIHAIEENSCLVEYKMDQFIKYQFYFCEIMLKHQVFNSINSIASLHEEYKIQIGGIGIRCPFHKMSGILLNMKALQKHISLLCDELECEDEELRTGTLFKMTFYRYNSMGRLIHDFILLKVMSVNYNHQQLLLRLVSIHQSGGIPPQEIEQSLQIINNEYSYFNIKNIFKQAIPRQKLIRYAKQKLRVLEEIKNLCEKRHFKAMINK